MDRRDEALALYRTMGTRWLVGLRRAFELDLAAGSDEAFCRGRIAAIDEVLRERGANSQPVGWRMDRHDRGGADR